MTALSNGNVEQTKKQTKELRTEQKRKRNCKEGRNKKDGRKRNIHKELWKELIAYFPFIRRGPYRKPKERKVGNADKTHKQQCDLISFLKKFGRTHREQDDIINRKNYGRYTARWTDIDGYTDSKAIS
jgi:hypothetical protein